MIGLSLRDIILHSGVVALLVVLAFVLPEYHHGNVARVLVLSVFAMGYNIAFGYTGMLSLGHALFFAGGLYAMGLSIELAGLSAFAGLILGVLAGVALALVVGVLALRTVGVAFMIVTLMFAQAGYLVVLYFGEFTRGDEGFVVASEAREIAGLALSDADVRYWAALALFALALGIKLWLVRAPSGRLMAAVRENEARVRMLGYDPFRVKLRALVISAGFAAASGAAYGLLFGYVGASFASVQYSILPLLWVLLGGAGTVLGPFLGTLAMFYLVDIASGITDAYLIVVGVALVLLVLFARKGLLGVVRERIAPWLP